MTKKQDALRENVARKLCSSRGADPDAPITIVTIEGTQETFDPAWTGYLGIADEVIQLVRDGS